MTLYAQMDGNKVINTIVGNLQWLSAQPNPESFREYTVDNPAYIGGDYVDGTFYAPQFFPSWTRDGKGSWNPPTPMPTDDKLYSWDESTTSWVVMSEL
jgi:hypothetical protein